MPEGQRLFRAKGISCWTLQQDNDPAHGDAAGVVRGWSEKKPSNARVLPNWPPNSPDLNLIENVWGYVQGNVDALGCQSFEEFKNAVHEQFKAVPSSMLSNLYSSMGKRLHTVVKKGGGKDHVLASCSWFLQPHRVLQNEGTSQVLLPWAHPR